jgi:tetratricopeptide (TPR) repeat protein
MRALFLLAATGVLLFSAPPLWSGTPGEAHEFASLLAKLASDSVEQRRTAAEALSSFGSGAPDATPATEVVSQELDELRRHDDLRVVGLMRELHERGGRAADPVEALVQLRPDPAVEHALATLCSMRALARIGTAAAVRQLVLVAGDGGGVYRRELFRELSQLDERAIAPLIEARASPSLDTRMWAKDTLEALGRRTPGDAVQTANDQVIIDVLHAYAAVRDVDAVAVVLSFVNSDRSRVRTAAREASLAFGQEAQPRLRSTYAALTGERLPEGADAADVAQKLFDAYDHYRMSVVYQRLDQGLTMLRTGDVSGAIAAFDHVLALQPSLDRGAEIVPAYVTFAESLESSDRARALDYLRRALRLDHEGAGTGAGVGTASGPSGSVDAGAGAGAAMGASAGAAASAAPLISHVRSEIRYLEGEELLSRGIVDAVPFEQAVALDPANAHARGRLDQLRADAAWKRKRENHIAAGVGAAGLSLVMLGLFGLSIWRRRRDLDAPA